jgi:hypothetical protein
MKKKLSSMLEPHEDTEEEDTVKKKRGRPKTHTDEENKILKHAHDESYKFTLEILKDKSISDLEFLAKEENRKAREVWSRKDLSYKEKLDLQQYHNTNYKQIKRAEEKAIAEEHEEEYGIEQREIKLFEEIQSLGRTIDLSDLEKVKRYEQLKREHRKVMEILYKKKAKLKGEYPDDAVIDEPLEEETEEEQEEGYDVESKDEEGKVEESEEHILEDDDTTDTEKPKKTSLDDVYKEYYGTGEN